MRLSIIVGAGVLFGLFIGAASWVLLLVPGPHDSARQIIIARGQSLDNVTRELAALGVLRSALVFSVYSRFAGPVQAGEFDLPPTRQHARYFAYFARRRCCHARNSRCLKV
ncbi:MAG: hypothetical protein CM15mP21_4100 [Hyphomicrobiales bacterium]|nr:MAG: hypothetical protein CM15mP21_4100 [Hyphomicrobiales bacterium]